MKILEGGGMSKQILIYQAIEQIQNDLYDYFYTNENFNMSEIEKIVLSNTINKFGQATTADLMGICTRSIRTKISEYGLQNLQAHRKLLQIKASEVAALKAPRGCDSARSDGDDCA